MTTVGNILFLLMVLSGIMIFLTYTPSDPTFFWTYWCLVTAFFFFGFLIEKMFCVDLTFVFDPSYENWARKTDPQS